MPEWLWVIRSRIICKTVYDGCLDKISNLVLDRMAGLELQLDDTLAYALELNRE